MKTCSYNARIRQVVGANHTHLPQSRVVLHTNPPLSDGLRIDRMPSCFPSRRIHYVSEDCKQSGCIETQDQNPCDKPPEAIMTKNDSFQTHERFVKRILIGAAVSISGIFAGYALSGTSATPSAQLVQTVEAVQLSDTHSTVSLNRMERIALRRISDASGSTADAMTARVGIR